MFREFSALALVSLVILTGCGSRSSKPVEALVGTRDVSTIALTSLYGSRDGERLAVRASYGDGSANLQVDLQFNVTPPARLTSGTWAGLGGKGVVRERSVTFLGGQSGAPSVGGRFDLIGPDGQALYRITIPLQELKTPLSLFSPPTAPPGTDRQ
jgi:hypothetical protein